MFYTFIDRDHDSPSVLNVVIGCCAGELADAESMVCMKDMMNSLGVENLATDGTSAVPFMLFLLIMLFLLD